MAMTTGHKRSRNAGTLSIVMAMVALATPTIASAQLRQPPSPTAAAIDAIAPSLADYTSRVLFGDVWERRQLPVRDRSLITLSATLTTGKLPQLGRHIARALDNGVKPSEVVALIVHVGFYSGWPNASSGIETANRVFQERGVDRAALRQSPPPALPALGADRTRPLFRHGEIAATTPKLAELTDQIVYGDLWRRADLSRRDRSLVTLASLIADGSTEQLDENFRFAMANGLTREEIGEAITHLAFYAGWPKAVAAAKIAQKSLAP